MPLHISRYSYVGGRSTVRTAIKWHKNQAQINPAKNPVFDNFVQAKVSVCAEWLTVF